MSHIHDLPPESMPGYVKLGLWIFFTCLAWMLGQACGWWG